MLVSHLVAKAFALVTCGGAGALFVSLGVGGVRTGRLPMRVGEVRGRAAVALGVVYLVIGCGLIGFGIALVRAPIR